MNRVEAKVGIVIQGPLLSRGRTGKTAHIPFCDVQEKHVVDFDTISTVLYYFETYPQYEIVVSTWRNQPAELIQQLTEAIEPTDILLLEDKTPAVPVKGAVIAGNNNFRQFYSLKNGVETLAERGCEIIVKVRTDQVVDVRTLILDYEEQKQHNPRVQILIPFALNWNVEWVEDFFFVASPTVLKNISSAYLRGPELSTSVHENLFYTIASLFLKITIRSYLFKSILSSISKSTELRVWDFIALARRESMSNVIWRGEYIDMSYVQSNGAIFYNPLERKRSSNFANQGLKTLVHRIINKVRLFNLDLMRHRHQRYRSSV